MVAMVVAVRIGDCETKKPDLCRTWGHIWVDVSLLIVAKINTRGRNIKGETRYRTGCGPPPGRKEEGSGDDDTHAHCLGDRVFSGGGLGLSVGFPNQVNHIASERSYRIRTFSK